MENDSLDDLQQAQSSFKDMYSKLYGVPREELEDVSINELEQFETAFKKRANKVQFKKIEPANVSVREDEIKNDKNIKQPLEENIQIPTAKERVDQDLNVTTSSAAKSLPLNTETTNTKPSIELHKQDKPITAPEITNTVVVKEQIQEKVVDPKEHSLKENAEIKPDQTSKLDNPVIDHKDSKSVIVEPKKPEIPDITDLDKKLKMETAHLPEPPSIKEESINKESPKISKENKPTENSIDKMVDRLLEHPMHKKFQEPSKNTIATEQPLQEQPLQPEIKTTKISQADKSVLPQPAPPAPATTPQPLAATSELKTTSSLPLNTNLKNEEVDMLQTIIDNFKNISELKKEILPQSSSTASQGIASSPNETGAVSSNIFNVSQQPTLPEIASKFNIPITQTPTEISSPSEQTLKTISTNVDTGVKSITTVLKEIKISMEGLKGAVDLIAAIIPNIQGGSTVNTQVASRNNGANTINSGMINNYKNEIRNQTGSSIIDIKNTRGSYPGFTI